MKVGILWPNFSPEAGGGFTFAQTILEAVKKHKSCHEFCILSNERGSFDKAILRQKIELVWFLTPSHSLPSAPFITTVWDVGHRLQPYFPELSLSGWTWKEREKYYNITLRRAAFIITGTKVGKEQIKRFYHVPEERTKILPHPTPTFALEKTSLKVSKRFIRKIPKTFLFYPANFWPHKNHIGLLHALKILKGKYKLNFSLVFTGSNTGNLNYVKRVVSKLSLKNDVCFLGFVSCDELIYLYKKAFALTYVSFLGPENLPPLEALALGCPVIASKIVGSNEQLGRNALFVDPKDEKDIAKKIAYLYFHPKVRKKFVEKGFEKAKKWTADDFVKAICKIIDEFEPYRRCWSSKRPFKHL